MVCRFANASDYEQIAKLLDELIKETILRGAPPSKIALDVKKRKEMFESLIEREDIKIFVMEDNNRLVAFADVFIIPVMRRAVLTALIEDFVVTKEKRGKGIGTKLMQEIMKYCKKQHIPVIKLTSGIELLSAHRFYEKLGGKFSEKLFRFDL